jgi:TPR repeat protein
MNEWNIQSRAHACQACEKHFADKQHYHTLLIDHKHEVQRRDLCEPCWKKEVEGHAAETKGFISQWQGVYEAPPAAPPEAIQKENAESLLRKIMEQNEPKYAAASYILAVMLERKRLLKIKEQFKRDGQRVFVYEQPKTGDIFTIPDPDLQLNQLEEVQRMVADLLEHGLGGPAETPAAAELVAEVPSGAAEIPLAAPADESATQPATAEPVAS